MPAEMPKWTIEPAQVEDAEGLAAMHAESFKAAYFMGYIPHDQRVVEAAAQFAKPERIAKRRALINHAQAHPELATFQAAFDREHRPLGFIYGATGGAAQELVALYVRPGFFDRGIGSGLVGHLLDWADPSLPVELGVVRNNRRARGFYEKMGFQVVGNRVPPAFDFMPEFTMVRPAGGEQ